MTTLRRLAFLALLAVWLALPAVVHAQTTTTASTTTITTTTVTTTTVTTTTVTTTTVTTTTTTTSTTTTTLIPDNLVTHCTITSDQPLGSGKYHVSGHLTGAVSYLTGGMPFAIPNTLKAAGRCLCNSFARKPLTVIFSVSYSPNAGAAIKSFSYQSATHSIVAGAAQNEMSDGDDISLSHPDFFAICQ